MALERVFLMCPVWAERKSGTPWMAGRWSMARAPTAQMGSEGSRWQISDPTNRDHIPDHT